MERRSFLKGTIATGLTAAFAPINALAGIGKEKNYIEYFREVCDTLDELVDYRTGEPFEQNDFAIAYFCTPYSAYPGQGCATDALNIYQSKNFAEMITGEKIQAIMVLSPLEKGDPPPKFADSYTDTGRNGNFHFTGLTGEKDKVLDTARNYRASFEIDRKTGHVEGHNRSAVLISPKGELIAKYSPKALGSIENDIANHIRQYKDYKIKQAHGCEP